jgi:uncharacterized protein (TIGR00369 family)
MANKPDSMKLNPAYIEAVIPQVNECPYFRLLSMEIKTLEWGKSHLEILVGNKHLQPFGMAHGGVYASLIDAAAFWAVYTQIEADSEITTVELKVNYLAPASEGHFIAKGKSIKVGERICLAETLIENEKGRLLAHGTATMMITDSVKMQGKSRLPSKFLKP